MMINQYDCLLHSAMCQTEWSNNTIVTLSLLVYLRLDQEILLRKCAKVLPINSYLIVTVFLTSSDSSLPPLLLPAILLGV